MSARARAAATTTCLSNQPRDDSDIADALGTHEGVAPVLRAPLYSTILSQSMQVDDEKLQTTAAWAQQVHLDGVVALA